jgi:hypothetical protein
MGDKQIQDFWAVVGTAGGKYFLGNIISCGSVEETLKVLDRGETVELNPNFEVGVNLIPLQTREGIQMRREVGATPFIMTLHGATLHVKPVAIQFLSEMNHLDAAGYKRLAEDAEKAATRARAAIAGISLVEGPQRDGGNKVRG